ncbi:MAG TPA: 4-(cytidine 5'-diphospho)-2-C-methyl-D-erythritol kinase [Mycobacteriales bacterium]|nr:4-(cytidine 5'-diphospho)-2-C-methyl-D-erythritol kinase [Mycobacteriales bacterium]
MLAGVPEPVTVRVPAKINLALQVGQLRPDGYHDLATVFQAVSLYDEVTATPATGISVAVAGEGADTVPSGPENIAYRAAQALAADVDAPGGVALEIAKGIPVAGGMAGGSADAAGTLVACDALWGTNCDRGELTALAARLGSDVPFLLRGGTALGTSRGEILADVLARGTYHWVLALADGGLSTPEVYAAFDRLGSATGPGPDGVLAALRTGRAEDLAEVLVNDLQPAAISLRPSLSRVLDAGADIGALGGVVSGSGPTVALLASSAEHAAGLAAQLAGLGVCRTVRRAYGPVAGARVVDVTAR